MQIKRYSDGSMKLHIDDEDNYNVTDDNGVDVWLTKKQVERIKGERAFNVIYEGKFSIYKREVMEP